MNTLSISKEKNLTEKEVVDKLKGWIINGFLIKLQVKLYKLVANYNNISENYKYIFEHEIIKGKSELLSPIENFIEKELLGVDLSDFTESEMNELKQYFDGTRKKKLEALLKKKKKLSKMKKSVNKVIMINELGKTKNQSEEDKAKLEKEKQKIRQERRAFLEKMQQEKRTSTSRIKLHSPKYKNIIKLSQSEDLVKYLSKSYIISSIFKDILSFISAKFHWLCFFIMILNHILSYSIISLFYPISIFCYAIMEYPRPKKSYWFLCFIYTIISLVLKFFIQLDVWDLIPNYAEKIQYLDYYLIGFKLCESTFSQDFIVYILPDALVLIFLLINNYLLVFAGLFDKREQEIETIYQANERIARTKDLKFNIIEDIKKLNNDYLANDKLEFGIDKEPEIKKEKIEEKKIGGLLDLITTEKKEKEKEKNIIVEEKEMGIGTKIEKKDGKKENYFKRIKKEKKAKEKEKKEMKEVEIRKKLFKESQRKYIETLFPEARNEKPGEEYYVSYTIAMTFIIIYVFLFYTTMIKDKTFGAVSMETKQFSGEMVCFLLLHIAFLVADRIIYIRQNRYNIKYQYVFYDKINGKIIKNLEDIENIKEFPKFKTHEIIIPPAYEEQLKDRYSIIYIQKEDFNKPLFSKYIMHMTIVIFGHVFIFFYMTMYGNYKLNRKVYCNKEDKECNDFLKNNSLIIFYLIYIVYFICSGLQVKYGFYDMKRKSVLKAKSNSIYGGVYAGYKAVPFLYELKLGIDWTFTTTCLDLFQWNKFESLYDVIYTTNCAMTGTNVKKVGQPVKKGSKIGMGGGLSFVLLLVLVGPLLLFSSLNPTNELNNLTNADLTIELSFLYKNKLMKNYTIFENTKPQSIEPISKEDFEYYNYSKCIESKNFPMEQIQTVKFFEENDRNWDLSRPHIQNLIELIQSVKKNASASDENENYIERIDLIMDYTFFRPLPPEAQIANKRYNNTIYARGKSNEDEVDNLSLLGDALANCQDVNITYKNKIYPPIRLRASSHPKTIKSPEFFNNLDVQIGFVGCKKVSDKESGEEVNNYLESYFTFSTHFSDNHTDGIKFHVFSDKASSTTFSYNALTFYVAFVLVVGTYVRNFLSAQPEKIILTEMPHNEEVLDLCEGIKISRHSYDFKEEEKLYYILIEIMRSPEILILLTQSSMDQFENRLKMTKEEEEKEKELEEKNAKKK